MGLFGRRPQEAAPAPPPAPQVYDLPDVGAVTVSHVLDCSGENCPRPQLRTKKMVLQDMRPGEVMMLIVDNPSSPELVPSIMDNIGAVYLGTLRSGGEWRLFIQKR